MAALALTAVVILASFAGAAQAKQWYTGAKEELLKGSTATTMTLTKHPYAFERGPKVENPKTFHIGWEFGSVAPKIPILMAASGVECVECKITNETPKPGVAQGTGRIKFTEVTVIEPAGEGCWVSGSTGVKGTLLSQPLRWEFVTVGGKEFIGFYPLTGSAYLPFSIGGGSCSALSGSYSIGGSLFAKGSGFSSNSTTHEFSFTEAIQKEAGGHLTTGVYPITFEGTLSEALTSGQTWLAK